jgi:hypothetical protein
MAKSISNGAATTKNGTDTVSANSNKTVTAAVTTCTGGAVQATGTWGPTKTGGLGFYLGLAPAGTTGIKFCYKATAAIQLAVGTPTAAYATSAQLTLSPNAAACPGTLTTGAVKLPAHALPATTGATCSVTTVNWADFEINGAPAPASIEWVQWIYPAPVADGGVDSTVTIDVSDVSFVK